ncbi:DUF58 domain-containing protein [Cohnella terricola]|uniref:DUF58 domain-containing protein n=1 Tax=Cohnella terricola TaxID=1289167 RepID=A0A559JIV9_9BACL|nr:DUF58 domain-containing protein [Cohnella terricola]TVX99814.1 DUF58 domain-containing protein [Cohnella terricola]
MTTSSKKRSRPFRFLGRLLGDESIVPTRRLVVIAAIGSVLIGAAYALDYGNYSFWGFYLLLAIFSAVDLLLLPARKRFSVERTMPEAADIRQSFKVRLALTANTASFSLNVELADDIPISFTAFRTQREDEQDNQISQAILHGRIEGGPVGIEYDTAGQERGLYAFGSVMLRYWGGVGLWKKQTRLTCRSEVRIVPDLSRVRGVLASAQDSLVLDGSKLARPNLAGTDFDSIRNYAQGDDPRRVNWRATARSGKLMTNILRPEKGKVVTILLDCGRMMGVELEHQTKLDRTLEAALVLAAVALKQGDYVALLAFSDRIKTYVPPGRGLPHLHQLTMAAYDLKSDFVETGFGLALSHLLRQIKKRSFVVMFSDMESYLYDQELPVYARRLRRSHVPLLVSLNDPLLHEWARAEPTNNRTAYIQSLAHKFRLDRSEYVSQMASMGIQVLDVPADRLALSAVNEYLNLKARNAL